MVLSRGRVLPSEPATLFRPSNSGVLPSPAVHFRSPSPPPPPSFSNDSFVRLPLTCCQLGNAQRRSAPPPPAAPPRRHTASSAMNKHADVQRGTSGGSAMTHFRWGGGGRAIHKDQLYFFQERTSATVGTRPSEALMQRRRSPTNAFFILFEFNFRNTLRRPLKTGGDPRIFRHRRH